MRLRSRSGDKHHLRKSTDRKAQISPVSGTNAFLIYAFRSADFLRRCLSLERNLTHAQSLLLFPIVFGIKSIHFFSMRRRTVQPEIRSFVSLLRTPVTLFDSANFTKNANCFERCNVLGHGKCEAQRHSRGEKLRCTFLARKSAKFFANTKVQFFGKEKCKTQRQFQRYSGDVTSVSRGLSLSLGII